MKVTLQTMFNYLLIIDVLIFNVVTFITRREFLQRHWVVDRVDELLLLTLIISLIVAWLVSRSRRVSPAIWIKVLIAAAIYLIAASISMAVVGMMNNYDHGVVANFAQLPWLSTLQTLLALPVAVFLVTYMYISVPVMMLLHYAHQSFMPPRGGE